jgi:hypothetical protein
MGVASSAVRLGSEDGPNLDFSFVIRPGLCIDLEAEDDEPVAGFDMKYSWLNFSGKAYPNVTYKVIVSTETGSVYISSMDVSYKATDYLSMQAGIFKVPFARNYNTSASRLLFYGRPQLIAPFHPMEQIGFAAKLSTIDKKYYIDAGVFNGDGLNTNKNFGNIDKGLMFTALAGIAPLGAVPMQESARNGFDKLVFSIEPGISINKVTTSGVDKDVTSFALQGALRFSYLAIETGYFNKTEKIEDTKTKTHGLGAQAGYAFFGKFEPCVRFSILDPDSDNDDSELTPSSNVRTQIEAGINYYFHTASNRLGLSFNHLTAAKDDNDVMKRSKVNLFYEMFF